MPNLLTKPADRCAGGASRGVIGGAEVPREALRYATGDRLNRIDRWNRRRWRHHRRHQLHVATCSGAVPKRPAYGYLQGGRSGLGGVFSCDAVDAEQI
eukprot:7201801-Alexandrium_andersonii.AAC.1